MPAPSEPSRLQWSHRQFVSRRQFPWKDLATDVIPKGMNTKTAINTKTVTCVLAIGAGLLSLLSFVGCGGQDRPLRLTDLTAPEHNYCEHIVLLERAKSVARYDRDRGDALLDSLAAAWGDSVESDTIAGLSTDPYRIAALAEFLGRVVAAEQDSLRQHPGLNRIHLPLPEPKPRQQ